MNPEQKSKADKCIQEARQYLENSIKQCRDALVILAASGSSEQLTCTLNAIERLEQDRMTLVDVGWKIKD